MEGVGLLGCLTFQEDRRFPTTNKPVNQARGSLKRGPPSRLVGHVEALTRTSRRTKGTRENFDNATAVATGVR